MARTSGMRVAFAALAAVVAWGTAESAEAQQMMVGTQPQHDNVRVSGFLWRAKPSGTLDFLALSQLPGFEQGIDVTDGLGFDATENGWIIEGNVAAGRRHRFIVETSRLDATGEVRIDFPGVGPVPSLSIDIDTDLNLREFHAFYNFLFVASPQAEFGVLAGVAWFDIDAGLLASGVGSARASLDQAFPAFGANLLINPKGPVRGYVEGSGFPRVEIDDLSGWQFDFLARLEVFPVRNFGLIFGYRRYRLVFDEGDDINLDLIWDGFTFGAQARF